MKHFGVNDVAFSMGVLAGVFVQFVTNNTLYSLISAMAALIIIWVCKRWIA